MIDTGFIGRRSFAITVCLLLLSPFLVVTIPPLTDVPGHMGSAAASAYADDRVFAQFMRLTWHLVPNLGTDLIVAAARRMLGITGAYRLAAAVIPPLLGAGILMVARALNPCGAAAIGWALVFVYCYPFNYGFLNYMLGVALALIGFASWIMLDRRPALRELATWIALPLLFLCHVVAGCLFVLFVGSRELAELRHRDQFGRFLRRIRPLLLSILILLLWRLSAQSFLGRNHTGVHIKLNALVMLLRDQNRLLDQGSLLAALAVFALGWRSGARPHRAVGPALLGLIVLFVVTPSSLSGSSFSDERLLPLIPILAFATQDWSRAAPRLARLVLASGLLLFVLRLGLTFAGFVAYDARYTTELAALGQVSEHSRVLVLNGVHCSARDHWRTDRLGHLGDLAIVYRRSWTNSEWDVDGAHLLQIRYRPSPMFYDDPSQYVWEPACRNVGEGRRDMHDVLPTIPYGGIDYLWLIDAALPAGASDPRLVLRWKDDISALYAVTPPQSPEPARHPGPN